VARTNKKHTAESALLLALQNEHGYMLHDVPAGRRTTMLLGADPKRPGKKTITAARVVQLVVPMDSALAAALNKHVRATEKPRTARRPR
jgi:hypothetical protein